MPVRRIGVFARLCDTIMAIDFTTPSRSCDYIMDKKLGYLVILSLGAWATTSTDCAAESLCNWEISVTEVKTQEVRYYRPKTDKGESGPTKIRDGTKLVAQCFFSEDEPAQVGDVLAQTVSALCTTGPDKAAHLDVLPLNCTSES